MGRFRIGANYAKLGVGTIAAMSVCMTNTNSRGTILVTGNTFPVKEALKALGGRWDAVNKGWNVPANNATKARELVNGKQVKPVSKFNRIGSGIPCGQCHGCCHEDSDGTCDHGDY